MKTSLKKSIVLAALSVPVLASAQNLITNGSFENGLTGWTSSTVPANSIYPVSVISYGSPGGAFGEVVTPDNAVSASPDAVGTKAAYFVKDDGTATITQSFTAAATGTYAFGFSTYAPANGFGNPNPSSFSATIGTASISGQVGSLPVTTWQAKSGTVNLVAGTTYTFSLSMTGNGVTAKDLVVDRVYVTAVPEPGTYALMAAGLAAVGFLARRRRAA